MSNNMDLNKMVKLGCISAVLSDNINKKLIGEVLTIVDATACDVQSKKAIKSLISQSFSRISNKVMSDLVNLQEKEEN